MSLRLEPDAPISQRRPLEHRGTDADDEEGHAALIERVKQSALSGHNYEVFHD